MSHQNTATPQINAQPAPIVLTIPTQNESQSEKQHILKVFPKKTILTFSIIQLTCAGLAAILQVWFHKMTFNCYLNFKHLSKFFFFPISIPIPFLYHFPFFILLYFILIFIYHIQFRIHQRSHSQMEHYFFSYLLTWKIDLIEVLEIMAQMWQYVIFLSLKPTKVTSDFILY